MVLKCKPLCTLLKYSDFIYEAISRNLSTADNGEDDRDIYSKTILIFAWTEITKLTVTIANIYFPREFSAEMLNKLYSRQHFWHCFFIVNFLEIITIQWTFQ
jgi:hypothetical protein